MKDSRTAILHYSTSPTIGGVETVISAHAEIFLKNGYPLTIISGRGEASAQPNGAGFLLVPEMDALNPEILQISSALERGQVPPMMETMTDRLMGKLSPILKQFDTVIVHNIFTKHFNLPLTAALLRLLDRGEIHHCIAWCHDFSWTSRNSRSKIFPGYPWDLLRMPHPKLTYVTISEARQRDLAALVGCPIEDIKVVYNGVDPRSLLGLTESGFDLIERMGLLQSELVLLMPVRITRAKNIEFAFRVVAALKKQDCHPALVITGPPDPHSAQSMTYFQSLQQLRQELGLEGEVRFAFEAGQDPHQAYFLSPSLVGELYRVSDLLFMPSLREGFGMPILEAGLVGLPVVSAPVPAAVEIGQGDILLIDPEGAPEVVARQILAWVGERSTRRLRQRVRQSFTWQIIFERDIEPLMVGPTPSQPFNRV